MSSTRSSCSLSARPSGSSAYTDTLIDIRKKQSINIPIGCVVTNYGWEIAAAIFFVPDMGKLLVVAYWGWMILDTFIFASCYRYGGKPVPGSVFQAKAAHVPYHRHPGILCHAGRFHGE